MGILWNSIGIFIPTYRSLPLTKIVYIFMNKTVYRQSIGSTTILTLRIILKKVGNARTSNVDKQPDCK
jgi:hypothetical protein